MNTLPRLEQCLSFINCQLKPAGGAQPGVQNGNARRAVTISRQTGSGAHLVADKLAACLQPHTPKDAGPWTIFDRNLVGKVLEDHHLPERLARFMAEDRMSEMADTMDELFGLHPPSWTLVRQTAETILHLAQIGNVILIGRGAGLITANLPHVVHVRLVGSLEQRTRRIMQVTGLTRPKAIEMIQKEDRGRARYLKKYFGRDIDDPLLYDLMINTDLISYDAAAHVIAQAVLHKKLKLEGAKN